MFGQPAVNATKQLLVKFIIYKRHTYCIFKCYLFDYAQLLILYFCFIFTTVCRQIGQKYFGAALPTLFNWNFPGNLNQSEIQHSIFKFFKYYVFSIKLIKVASLLELSPPYFTPNDFDGHERIMVDQLVSPALRSLTHSFIRSFIHCDVGFE